MSVMPQCDRHYPAASFSSDINFLPACTPQDDADMNKLFFSQNILDALISEGKIKLNGNEITIISKDNPTFELEPAFRFMKTADNSTDPYHFVGQIRPEKDLRESHAEIYMDSIIYKDTAYIVEPGFLGEKKELLDRLSDTDLLARFLLENLH